MQAKVLAENLEHKYSIRTDEIHSRMCVFFNFLQLFCVFQHVHDKISGNSIKKKVKATKRNKEEKAGIYLHEVGIYHH